MATTIVTKSGSGAPAASDLVAGELAVDLTNKRLYTEDSSAAIIELGTNPSGNVTFGDNGKAIFGAGSDLQIYHDGSHARLREITGDFRIQTTSSGVNALVAKQNAEVEITYAGATKLATTNTGIDISGTVTADTGEITRLGIGVAAHASSALNITSTDQHIRFNNGSELGIIDLDSDGELNIWAHGDGEVINLRTGSGSGTDIVKVTSTGIDVTGGLTLANSTAPVLKLSNTSGSISAGGDLGLIEFYSDDDSGGGNAVKATMSTVQPAASPVSGEVVFKTSESTGSLTERLRVKATGIDVAGTVTADGTASSSVPKYTFAGDVNTGLAYIGADAVGLLAAGSRKFYVNATTGYFQNLSGGVNFGSGIDVTGTVTADGLDVNSTTSGAANIQVGNAAGDIALGIGSPSTANKVVVTAGGSVGIGTSSPSETLAVESASNNAILLNSPANRYNAVGFQSAGVDKWWMGRADTDIIAGDAFFIGADAGNATDAGGTSAKLVIDSSGNVGIGTSSPNAPLEVEESGTGSGLGGVTASTITAGGNAGYRFATGGVDRFSLSILGAAGSESLRVYDSNNSAERMRIDASGNLLVAAAGIESPSGFDVNPYVGGIKVNIGHNGSAANADTYIAFRRNSIVLGSISQVSATGVAYNTTSDQRLKENIADADDAGSRVDAIQVRQFDWKIDGSHQDYGMVAQELQAVAPEAVSVPEDSDEMMSVDYSKLVPMMLKEIQSLRARIAQLES